MATTTGAVLRQKLSEIIGDYRTFTPESGTTTTAVALSLRNYTSANDDLKGWWWLGTSGDSIRLSRRISASVHSTGALTWLHAVPLATDTDTFELHKYDPAELHTALTYGIRNIYPTLYLPVRDETLSVDNLLLNWDFETFAGGAFTYWSNVGSATIAQDNSRKFQGTYAASITATGGTEGLTQNLFSVARVNVPDVQGKTLQVSGRVWCGTASSARLRITFGGGTYTNSAWHSGDEEWERLTVSAPVPVNASSMAVSCEVEDGIVAYFDNLEAHIDRVTRYTIPTSIINGPFEVLAQRDIAYPDGDYTRFRSHPSPGKILRLLGMGRLTVPTTDTATTEVDGTRADLIAWKAAEFFWNNRWAQTKDTTDLTQRAVATEMVKQLTMQSGVRMGQPTAEIPQGWSVEEDSSGNRYLLIP